MPVIRFLGAAREVTGSAFLVEAGGRRVLVDCGLIQASRREEQRNAEPFPFDPARLDAVVLTHAHIDHSGRLPLLVKSGFRGRIYTQRATRDLCRVMLRDAAYLQEKDADWTNRKRERKGLPPVEALYGIQEAEAALKAFRALDYDTRTPIAEGFTLRLRDAGHILGSAIAELWIDAEGVQRKLVFSGDLGHAGSPLLRNPTPIPDADLVIMESTYGDRAHRSWDATWQELGEIMAIARERAGNILIPAFAVGRTQELLYVLSQHYRAWGLENWQVFLDSPMAIQATEIYQQHSDLFDAATAARLARGDNPFSLPNLRLTPRAEDSMTINRIRSGALIIAGSGMCTGGRILQHFKHNLWRRDTHLVIVGFQAAGTLGRALVDGASHVRLWGETIRVGATVHTVGGLSAHADRAGLLRWYEQFQGRPPVALVHGEPGAMDALAAALRTRGAPTLTPDPGMCVDLAPPLDFPLAAEPASA
ncbi:MBL fold metallo-hydrolase [Ectothiorhodospiraceae bacterium 2226]|nr:MBL fold metallo-hydrolase [Ectothiorhodospiraceae bacterium 2226]